MCLPCLMSLGTWKEPFSNPLEGTTCWCTTQAPWGAFEEQVLPSSNLMDTVDPAGKPLRVKLR